MFTIGLLVAGSLGGTVRMRATELHTPNDPLFVSKQAYLADIDAPAAWDTQTGDPAVVVAVIDSGIDAMHPDLAVNIWQNPTPGAFGCAGDLHGCTLLDPNDAAASCSGIGPARTGDVSALSPHGTFLAGVIGAAGDNGLGIAGVAWHVSLMAVRVSDCRDGSNAETVAAGIRYAADAGARIAVLGLAASRGSGGGCRAPNRLLADAVQYARDRGVLVVAPAGDSSQPCVADPAAAPQALAVGGYQLPGRTRLRVGRGRTGSNWGPEIAIAAPALDIASTIPRQAGRMPPDDLYATTYGTPFAAGIVGGAAALLLSQNALLTPDWLTELLVLGARPLADGAAPGWAGAGAIDLAASLRLVPAGFAGALTVAGEPAPDGTPVEAYVNDVLCASTTSFTQNGRASYALLVPAAAMQAGCGSPGATVELRVNGVSAAQASWSAAAVTLDLDGAAAPGTTP